MNRRDAPEQASPEDEAQIGEAPAVFASRICVTPLPDGGRIAAARIPGHRPCR